MSSLHNRRHAERMKHPEYRRSYVLERLRQLHSGDAEAVHYLADQLLLEMIDDAEITKAFMGVPRWYA